MARILVLAFLCAPVLCQAATAFFFPASAGVDEAGIPRLRSPAASIVVLYTPGSDSNTTMVCYPGASVPPVFRNLAGTLVNGNELVVVGYCPDAVGNLDRDLSMSEARVPELQQRVRSLLEEGVPSQHLFIAGHSMGGWAAVRVGLQQEPAVAGVIAFAPANGINRRANRTAGNLRALYREQHALEGHSSLNALVYTFAGDENAEPESLAFLSGFPGVQMVQWPAPAAGAQGDPHFTVLRQPDFASQESGRILDFIRRHSAAHAP